MKEDRRQITFSILNHITDSLIKSYNGESKRKFVFVFIPYLTARNLLLYAFIMFSWDSMSLAYYIMRMYYLKISMIWL